VEAESSKPKAEDFGAKGLELRAMGYEVRAEG